MEPPEVRLRCAAGCKTSKKGVVRDPVWGQGGFRVFGCCSCVVRHPPCVTSVQFTQFCYEGSAVLSSYMSPQAGE